MKKEEKKVITVFGREMTLTVSEELNKLKGRILAPKMYEETKKRLSKVKSFPK